MVTRNLWGLMIIVVFLTSCITDDDFKKILGQENAVWAQGSFLRGYYINSGQELTDDDILRFTQTLRDKHIKYAYIFAGPYNEQGKLPTYAFSETAIRNVNKLKEYNPDLIILPWIGGVQNKQLYLGDSIWVRTALEEAKKLVDTLNVPGLHVDFEYILAGEPALDSTINKEKPGDLETYGINVNNFHKRLRVLLPNYFISSVVVATSPKVKSWKRKTTKDELKELIQHIDQLSFLFYDTKIDNQKDFQESCDYLLKDIETLQTYKDIQYLIGVGTFWNEEALRKYRDMTIENMPNTLETIKRSAYTNFNSKQVVDGIAIACDWTTPEEGWNSFVSGWSKYK